MSKISITTLGSLIEFQRGYDLPKTSFVEGDVPVISSNGILGYHNEYKVKGPGITIGRSGTVGLPHYIEENFYPHNTSLFIKDFKGNNPKYIYYLLKTLGLNDRGSGSGVPTMNRNHLHPLKVRAYLNPIYQEGIANVLTSIDSKIALNNRINAELEAMAKTVYDYWFVQFDFPFDFAQGKPNASGKPYKSSGGKMVWSEELKREVPEGWGLKSLGDYADIRRGELITAKDTEQGNIKVVAAGIDYSYTHSKSNKDSNTITISGSGANAGYINFWREPIFASDCITVRANSDTETLILLQFLKAHQIHILNQAKGSAQPHVYPSDIKILNYPIAPKELLDLYGDIVIPLNNRIANNQQENQQLSSLRDWLLPMLMNGQVKVGEVEAEVLRAAEPGAEYRK
ncbi:MAG: restriction endonuclease subunit S [Paludibacter sp.]|jgi:type I restriction enzyme S subunit|nr:restriction endonuclease subunit S [Paludibacter sp.]